VFTLLGQVDQWGLDLCEAQGTQPAKRRQRNAKRIFAARKRSHSCFAQWNDFYTGVLALTAASLFELAAGAIREARS